MTKRRTAVVDDEMVERLQRAKLDAEAAALGVRIATRCKTCGHWLVSTKSRAAHQGPRCASRSRKKVTA
ncbi:hypothetical protein [Rhodococcus sp. 1139]|uniref:hypothetical protein n=1 Tax=Rhodococcus sp. 1139 TaxID=1833762 RepID=UPI00159F33D6|nr:hypothetical protein [Rhodococcus sp. 1139]